MTNRCYYLDLAKVLATFLVIFGHLFSPDSSVRLYLYAFHMPLFFLISGVFHKDTKSIDWVYYCKVLLWPIAIFIVLDILVSSILWGGVPNLLRKYFIQIPLGNYKGILWFLFALFWCKVLTDIATRFGWLTIIVSWAVLLLVPILLNKRLPFELSQGLMAFPFYWLGFSIHEKMLGFKSSFRWLLPFILCLVFSILITRLHGRVSMVDLCFGHLAQMKRIPVEHVPIKILCWGIDVLLFYINGVIGSLMVLSLALLPLPKIAFISSISKSLITVVGTQYFFITPIIHFCGYNQPMWKCALLSIGIFALCYLLHLILRPIYRIVYRKSI